MVDVALSNRGRTAALAVAFVLLLTTVAFVAGVKAADTSVPVELIASGENYPDALVSGSAAAVGGGPVLLVTKEGIPAETAAELVRLNPDKIYIAGGTAAISAGVETQLAAYAPVVTRLWGSDRYATAAAISEAIFPATIGGVPGPEGPAGPAGADGAKGDMGDPGQDGAGGLSGLEKVAVSQVVTLVAGEATALTATCPAGKVVTFGTHGSSSPALGVSLTSTNGTFTQWTVNWVASVDVDVVITAEAICADVATS
jgi:hypothetical protein